MNGNKISRVFGACAVLAMLWIAGNVVEAGTYAITDLGTLGGSGWSHANGLNNSGQVVGLAATGGNSPDGSGPFDAFSYSGSTMTDLGALGGYWSGANSINDNGQAVGTVVDSAGHPQRAVLYSGGTVTDLGTLGGSFSQALGINNSGQIVGSASISDNAPWHAFLYAGSKMTDLGALSDGSASVAESINASGLIVGDSGTTGGWGNTHAFLYSGSTMNDLGTLGGSTSSALCINSSGQIVGGSNIAGDAAQHAYLYSGGKMTDLGALGGSYVDSYATSINDAGQIVGVSAATNAYDYGHAFLYSGSTMTDLNTLIAPDSGWTLYMASSINDQGQIAGYGLYDGSVTAFLLTPVPEPISMIFFGTGLVAVGGYISRKRMLRKA